MQTYEYILIFLALGNTVTMIVGFYKYFRDPDEKADKSLTVLSTSCVLKHNRIDEMFREVKESITTINSSLLLIKENDIKHIEQEMRRMSDVQAKILTILEYQEKTKL